jgi:hypothetical protein
MKYQLSGNVFELNIDEKYPMRSKMTIRGECVSVMHQPPCYGEFKLPMPHGLTLKYPSEKSVVLITVEFIES